MVKVKSKQDLIPLNENDSFGTNTFLKDSKEKGPAKKVKVIPIQRK